MQFISDRQSLAQQFAFQTKNQSSYLLSSRASRCRIHYQDGADPAQQQIEDFKQQIQQKYNQSVINKIYTFPFKYYTIQMFDDSQFKQLQGQVEISLYHEEQDFLSKNNNNMSKLLNKKIKNQKVNNLLERIKAQKQSLQAINLYTQDSLCESNETKPTNNASVRKSKGRQTGDKSGRIKVTYETFNSRQESPSGKMRLHTQPYEKPLGYILKKK